jgi:hypothetical protein
MLSKRLSVAAQAHEPADGPHRRRGYLGAALEWRLADLVKAAPVSPSQNARRHVLEPGAYPSGYRPARFAALIETAFFSSFNRLLTDAVNIKTPPKSSKYFAGA